MNADTPDATRQLSTWDERWARKGGEHAFAWYTREIPPELDRLLADTELPSGGALDVGCGPGFITAYLAGRFRPTFGIDIAYAAIEKAKRIGSSARFMVAQAPPLPFEDEVFALVFDRGCMHSIPRQQWRRYLDEVARVLRRGGIFELFFAGAAAKPKRPWYTRKGFKRRITMLLDRGHPRLFTREVLEEYLSPLLETLRVDQAPFRNPDTGRLIRFTHAVCRKR